MQNTESPENAGIQKLMEKMQSIEQRLNGIEKYLGLERIEHKDIGNQKSGDFNDGAEKENLVSESNIVEHGLSWLSSIVFVFGTIFLITYIVNLGHPVYASLVGYLCTAGILTFAFLFRKYFPHLVGVLKISALILIYYITLTLHFFSAEPVISNFAIALFLLLLAVLSQYYYALKQNTENLGLMATLSLLLSALFCDSTHVTLFIITCSSIISIYLFLKNGWKNQLIITMLLIYFSHLIWLINNPIIGHPIRTVSEPQFNIIYLFVYALAFSSVPLLAKKNPISTNFLGAIVILNALCFSFLISLESLLFYKASYMWIFAGISALCLIYSILLRSNKTLSFAPELYACFGFMALSISIYGFLKLPDAYLLLAFQSFLVVSMALWYRSRIIVIANTLLFILILLTYLLGSPSINSINIMFAFVAIATARILNWKKERLILKTEYLRNIYLVSGYFMILFGLNKFMPSEFVALSWILAAILFFIFSIILKNLKYRWLAIFTILVSGVHLLWIDMANMGAGLRIVVFMVFAMITLAISLFYTKRIKRKESQ